MSAQGLLSVKLGLSRFFIVMCMAALLIQLTLVPQGRAVAANSVSTSIGSNLATSSYGDAIVFTVSVTDSTTGGSTPTGSVTFMDGTTELGSAALSATTPTVESVPLSSHPTIPSGMKAYCSGSSTCPVVKWGDYTYWAYSYIDNRVSLGIVAYDSTGTIVKQWEKSGTRYISSITIDSNLGNLTFFGQSSSITLNWSDLEGWNSQASFTASTLSVGAHSITGVYSGDSNHAGNTTSALTQTVNKLATDTAITSTTNPSIYRQNVTFTATVNSSVGSPTGTIIFQDAGVSIGTGIISAGSASFTTTALSVGTHTITAVYSGDSDYSGSTSSILNLVVNQAVTTVTYTESVTQSTYLQEVTFSAAVSTAYGGTPTGTVTFKDDSTTIGTGTLIDGMASISTSNLSVGTHTLTVEYSGDANYLGSSYSRTNYLVNQAAMNVTLAGSPISSNYMDNVTFTAAITSSSGGIPAGTVTFKDGSTKIGIGTVFNGQATFTTSALFVGSHTITAVYEEGDSNYMGSTSNSLIYEVNHAATVISVTYSAYTSIYAENVAFTFTVTSPSEGVPTGTIIIRDGGTTIGTGVLTNGEVTIAINTLTAGTHAITATYEGDTHYASSLSAIVQHLVLDTSLLDINHDGGIHMDDIVRIMLEGTDAQKDFNKDGSFDMDDIRMMLQLISPIIVQ